MRAHTPLKVLSIDHSRAREGSTPLKVVSVLPTAIVRREYSREFRFHVREADASLWQATQTDVNIPTNMTMQEIIFGELPARAFKGFTQGRPVCGALTEEWQ